MTPEGIDAAWQRMDSGAAAAVAAEMAATAEGATELQLRAHARFDSGDVKGAAEDWEAVLALDGQNPVAQNHLALARYLLGDAAGAADLFDAAPLFPQFGFLARFLDVFWPLRATTGIARTNISLPGEVPLSAEFARFEEHAETVSPRLRGKLADAMVEKGGVEFERGRLAIARTLFERASVVAPKNNEAVYLATTLSLIEGESEAGFERLQPHFAEVLGELGKNPGRTRDVDPELMSLLAFALEGMGRYEDALRVIANVQPVGPDDWGSHFVASRCWSALGRRDESRRLLTTALGPFFLPTWDFIVRPFVLKAKAWLRTEEAAGVVSRHA